jgi:ribonuclease PH
MAARPTSSARRANQLRPIRIKRNFTRSAPGSVLMEMGKTVVLCTASVEEHVPAWMTGRGRGWMTAEYNMLPHSTTPRRRRERGKTDGRTIEIQRLIGRSLRAVANLDALGERTIQIDCDVLQADGGTRTASISGALVAVVDALRASGVRVSATGQYPLNDSLAAISVGLVAGRCLLDLDYELDSAAEVDMNVVMTGKGRYVEIQGSGEEASFDGKQLDRLLQLARSGIKQLGQAQQDALGRHWPF